MLQQLSLIHILNTAVTKAQEKWQALTDDKLSEAEKLAKMTKEEKAEYKNRKLEKERCV